MTTLVERDAELGRVAQALREAADGTGCAIVVAGPLGIGKTALLHAFAGQVDGVTVLRASASPLEQDFDLGIVRQLLDCGDGTLALPFRRDDRLLVLVDDLQWTDDSSLSELDRLVRRVHDLRTVVVMTVREGEVGADRPAAASVLSNATCTLRPKALTAKGTAAVVRDRLAHDGDDEFAGACHDVTGGNPMLLSALVLALAVGGRPVTAAAVRSSRTSQARDRVAACVRAQPAHVQALLKAMVVLPDEPRIAAELAGLDELTAAEAIRPARKLGLVRRDGFAHSVVSEAVEETMAAAERTVLQERAVRLLHDRGRPAEEIAHQLLTLTTPQGAWAVAALRTAADVAMRRGAPHAAARYLRRALLDCSRDGEDRARTLVDLAAAERTFDLAAAVRTMVFAMTLFADPHDRAAAVIRLAPVVMGDAPPGLVPLLRMSGGPAGNLTGVERDLALRVEARLRYATATSAIELDGCRTRLLGLGPEPPLHSAADRELVAVLLHNVMLGVRLPSAEVVALANRVLANEAATSPHSAGMAPLLVSTLAAADAPGAAAGWLDQALEVARHRGDLVEQAMIRTEQSLLHLLSGQLAEAGQAAADAFELGAWDWQTTGSAAAFVSGAVALQLRDPVLTERVLAAAGKPANACLAAIVGLLRGSAAVLRGDLPGAVELLLDCGTQLDRSGWRNPVMVPWRSSLALLKHRLGHREEALRLAETERLIAEEWGAASGIGRAWRVLGAVTEGAHAVVLTRRAVEVLEGSGHRLELARALQQWARMTDDTGVWRRCLDLAVDIGATNIAKRAYGALDGTSPVFGSLTPSERRVALLAAAGRANQEIAEMLSVTSRAVEKHLTNAYRKLGVGGRTELGDALRYAVVLQLDG